MNTEAIRKRFESANPVPEFIYYDHQGNYYQSSIGSETGDMYQCKWAGYQQAAKDMEVTGSTSDGYHTFDELYEFRKMYNAALFNEWAFQCKFNVHKSKKHNDGEDCFGGGWFIVVALLPKSQITNYYKLEDWDLFNVPEYDKALFEYDGHNGLDTIERLKGIRS